MGPTSGAWIPAVGQNPDGGWGRPYARENRRVLGKIAFANFHFWVKLLFPICQFNTSTSTLWGAWKCSRARLERSPGNGPTVIDSCLAVTFEKVKLRRRERGKCKLSNFANNTTCHLLAWAAAFVYGDNSAVTTRTGKKVLLPQIHGDSSNFEPIAGTLLKFLLDYNWRTACILFTSYCFMHKRLSMLHA